MSKAKIQQTAPKNDRPILYDKYEVAICCEGYLGPLTAAQARDILNWETEEEFTARMIAETPGLKESKAKFGDDYLLIDSNKQRVRCWNNAKNRPFDLGHAKKLCQDTLNKCWEMNGENIIIGETGLVLSGQHRLVGLVLAVQEWLLHQHWRDIWETEPVIESSIFFGAKETPEVLRTYDNTKPRTLTDVFYTSPIFERLTPDQRRECSRMMDFAVDLLWKRTKAASSWDQYQTHSSSLDFFERHPKLKACIKHIFDNNANRVISALGLSPGQCSALMYLMGASSTDHEDYHFPGSEKKESQLKWDNWDKALQFWNDLVDPKMAKMGTVRDCLKQLEDPHTGATAKDKFKHLVIAKAWNWYLEGGGPITKADLDISPHLSYNPDRNTTKLVDEVVICGTENMQGIDCGSGEEKDDPPPPTEEELVEQKAKDQTALMSQMNSTIAAGKKHLEGPASNGQGSKPFTDEERAALVAKVLPKKTAGASTKTPTAKGTVGSPVNPVTGRNANNEKVKPQKDVLATVPTNPAPKSPPAKKGTKK